MDRREILDLLTYPLDADIIIRKKRSIKRILLESDVKWVDKNIAILGGSTTNDIQDIMELFLLNEGIRPTFYASEYNRFYEDAVFGNAELDAFSPDVVFVHTSFRNINEWPQVGMNDSEVDQMLQNQFERFKTVWESIAQRFACPIIQNNFDRPNYRLLGNKDITTKCGRSNFVFRLNGMLYEYEQKHESFYINDQDYISMSCGLNQWHNNQEWYLYKNAVPMKAVPEFALNVTRIIKAIYGKNKKVLSLDLDNTMWGGIIGDDGVEGIEIGAETPKAEAYLAFQKYIKEISKTGVLLTIDSKNDMENAVEGLKHPEGAVEPDDFVCIKANWNPKNINLLDTATELNLGIDSFVFVDDNPVERDIIKKQIPVVSVPDVGGPETYIDYVDRNGYFEIVSLTKDDLKRCDMYKANVQRTQSQQSFANYEDFLASLEMKATIRDFEPVYLQRIAQLTNKTNQFNLTTKRCSEAEITDICNDDNYIRLYGKLEDKFGDNGVVSVMFGHKKESEFHIDLWLMSCRVLKRNFEHAMMDCMVEECLKKGINKIYGYYYPTAKNGMVKTLYAELGFEKIDEDKEGNSRWLRKIDESYQQQNKVIGKIER